jgi:hypothetical protein
MSNYPARNIFLNNRKYVILLSLIFYQFFLVSCLSDPEDEILHLKVEETSCTEAWISIYGPCGRDITLQRDDNTIMEFTLIRLDTTVMDTGLTPNTTHSYQVTAGNETAGPVTITTMDTTGHNFTWEVYDFGGEAGYGSSSFSDVSIINESDIWVSGDISTAEGNFNAAHWDGEKWTLKNILYKEGFWEINTVFAFASDDIWFEAYMIWNGENFVSLEIPEIMTGFSITETWGKSSANLYVVGNSGQMRYYNGFNWQKIESGTTENIQDIWGAEDTKTGKDFILCTASQTFRESEDLLLKINDDNTVSNFDWPYEDLKPYSVWFNNERKIFVCGDRMTSLTGLNSWKVYDNLSPYFMYNVRGSDLNDIYTVGGYGYIAHFNGKTWYELPEQFYGRYVSIDVKGNMAVAVGYTDRSARVVVLNRND